MPYRTLGLIHRMLARCAREARGQGTVEYVGLMLLLATVLTGVVAAAGGMHGGGIAQTVVHQIEHTISSIGSASP